VLLPERALSVDGLAQPNGIRTVSWMAKRLQARGSFTLEGADPTSFERDSIILSYTSGRSDGR
jgi:hypothetical protein